MNRAIIFGTGNTACGVLGQVTFQSGLITSFVGQNANVINAINNFDGYFLKLIERGSHYMSIRDCHALHCDDHSAIVHEIARSQVVLTAMGVNNLKHIAPFIIAGLLLRKRREELKPLNIIACEGLPGTSEYLYHQLLAHPEFSQNADIKKLFGFASAMSNRIVLDGEIEHGELTFTADKNCELVIDGKFLKGESLPLSNVTISNDFPSYYMQNQYILNCAITAAAYFGHQHGDTYIHETLDHPNVLSTINGALHEAQSALITKFPKQLSNIIKASKFAMMRLRQKELKLRIDEFTDNPLRILKAQDCLFGPMLLAQHFNLPFGNLAKTVAAVLRYRNENCLHARQLQEQIHHYGIEKTLNERSSLAPYHPVVAKIKSEYVKFNNPPPRESLYHSLKSFSQGFFNH